MEEKIRAIIAELNSLTVGEVDAVLRKLSSSHRALVDMGQQDLAAKLKEAEDCIKSGDVASFRKLVTQVLSKVGHVRSARPVATPAPQPDQS